MDQGSGMAQGVRFADRGYIVETIAAIFIFLDLAAVAARFRARQLIKSPKRLDDHLIVLSLVHPSRIWSMRT